MGWGWALQLVEPGVSPASGANGRGVANAMRQPSGTRRCGKLAPPFSPACCGGSSWLGSRVVAGARSTAALEQYTPAGTRDVEK